MVYWGNMGIMENRMEVIGLSGLQEGVFGRLTKLNDHSLMPQAGLVPRLKMKIPQQGLRV